MYASYFSSSQCSLLTHPPLSSSYFSSSQCSHLSHHCPHPISPLLNVLTSPIHPLLSSSSFISSPSSHSSLISYFYYSPLVNTASQDGCIPEHKGSAYIGLIEGHIDFMSAIIMLLRATQLQVKVYDLWEGINQDRSEHNGAKIQVCSSFDWSTLQIAIHRTTAKAMFGIVQRIYDFIMQQKKRSERTIGLMLPAGTAASTAFAAYQEEQIRAEKSRAAEIR